MEQEIFEVSFEYKGQKYKAKVKTVMPNGPEKVDYEISMIAGYAFRIHSHQEESMLCWKSKELGVDLEFVRVIGEAVERHYL